MEGNVKKCKYCQGEIDANAKVCPLCQRKLGAKGWQITLIVIGGLFFWRIYFGIISSIFINSENKPIIDDSDSSQRQVSIDTTNNNSNIEKKFEKTEFEVGESYEGNGMTINYISCNADFKEYSKYASLKYGYKVVKLEFEFINTYLTDADVHPSSYDFECYADGYVCDSFYSVDDSSFYLTLSKGKKGKGNIYYEVPINSQEIIVEYETNFWTNKKIIFKVQ